MFSPAKMTLIWLAVLFSYSWRLRLTAPKPFTSIPNHRRVLDRRAQMIRWSLIGIGIVLIWQGWRLAMSAVWDVATVMAGSLLFVLFFYVPDFAYGISDGVGRLVGKGT
jgi:hypothetical protein